MSRKPSLAEAVTSREPMLSSEPAPLPLAKTPAARPPSRAGRKGVAFWVDPDAARQLRIVAAEEDRTVQSLMEEALDLLFQNRGRYRLAKRSE